MFLKHLRSIRKSLWFKLALFHSSIFILSSVLLFALTYYFLSSALLKQNHESILAEANELAARYASSGIASLEGEMAVIQKSRKREPFFIRVVGARNETLQLFFPYQWAEFDVKKLERTRPDESGWISIPAIDEEYSLEVTSASLPDGNWLQVGLSTENRTRVLKRFREIFADGAVLLVVLGFISGTIVALRALRPVQRLVRTVHAINSGKMDTRVERTGAGDELDELAGLFNEMLGRIEFLISAMKGSLDNLAHDLRTPLTRFRNRAEIALSAGGDAVQYRETLADCIEESERISRMLNTLMDISEAETGIMRLDKRKTKIKELMENVIDLYQYVAEENGLSVEKKISEDLCARVDPDRMGQAMANLLDNAIKYTPAGGQIFLEAFLEGKDILIRVKDTGVGIPPEALPRIWERLYRGDPSRSKAGLGLGLSQVKAIIEAHNGRVEVKSEPGKGAVFSVYLPIGE